MIYNQTFGAPATGLSVADIATISKLVRNTMMMVVIPAMTFLYMPRAGQTQSASERGFRKAVKLFPLFVLGFVMFAIFRSIGDAGIKSGALALGIWTKQSWAALTGFINQWSTYILATAMAGVGLGTSFKTMKGLGIKPFYVGLFSATLVGVVAAVMVFLLGRFVIL